MQHTPKRTRTHANRLQQLYKDSIYICLYICTCARVCILQPQTKKFALHIAHFANFVLKICIKTAQISFICCKTLNKQRFLVFCLVVSKYVCTFATQLRTKGNNKHNENKTRKAARHITGQKEHWTGHSINAVMTANCSGFPPHSPEQGKGAHGEDNYPCDASEL